MSKATNGTEPTRASTLAARANQERCAAIVPPDPWQRLYRAGMDMATAAQRAARADYDDEDARQRAVDAASEFARAYAELEHCYRGVRIAHCTCCGQLRRMSEPREWEAEIVENGGPRWTSECLHCHSTIRVA